jgi:hypothetical protein
LVREFGTELSSDTFAGIEAYGQFERVEKSFKSYTLLFY